MRCPHCITGFLEYQIGYVVYASGMGAVHSEDRVVCINCARHRYLTEQDATTSPKGRRGALPVRVLAVAPAAAVRRARRWRHQEVSHGPSEAHTSAEEEYGQEA